MTSILQESYAGKLWDKWKKKKGHHHHHHDEPTRIVLHIPEYINKIRHTHTVFVHKNARMNHQDLDYHHKGKVIHQHHHDGIVKHIHKHHGKSEHEHMHDGHSKSNQNVYGGNQHKYHGKAEHIHKHYSLADLKHMHHDYKKHSMKQTIHGHNYEDADDKRNYGVISHHYDHAKSSNRKRAQWPSNLNEYLQHPHLQYAYRYQNPNVYGSIHPEYSNNLKRLPIYDSCNRTEMLS